MDQENRDRTPAETGTETPPPEPPRKPYSKKARALAWAGIAFMVFLTIMYYYIFASGKILFW